MQNCKIHYLDVYLNDKSIDSKMIHNGDLLTKSSSTGMDNLISNIKKLQENGVKTVFGFRVGLH